MIKHNLMEAHKQFMRLSEGYLATSLSEDGDEENTPEGEPVPDDNNQPEGFGQQPDENGGQEGMGPNGGDMPDLGGEQPQQEPDFGGQAPDFGGEPQPMGDTEDFDSDIEEDDVLDVEDLTQAQEKLNKKQNTIGRDLGEVDDRIIALLTAVEKIQGSLEKNNNDITALKQELEKRVPTDTEKLNMQSLKMYPFNVSPNEYWNDKEKEGRYEAEDDDKKKEYKITRDDVDGYTDRDIENSFDDELNQTMKDIFKGF